MRSISAQVLARSVGAQGQHVGALAEAVAAADGVGVGGDGEALVHAQRHHGDSLDRHAQAVAQLGADGLARLVITSRARRATRGSISRCQRA